MTEDNTLKAIIQDGGFWQDHDDVLVPWWSFSKTCLASAALALVARGRLELDTLLSGKPYTLRQLLQHTAGVANYGGLQAYHDAVAKNEEPWPIEKLLTLANANQSVFPPGKGWAYSNIGYYYVRRLIEQVTGKALDDALNHLVFAPLEIDGARVVQDRSDMAWEDCSTYHPGWVYHGLVVGTPSQAAQFLHKLMAGHLLPSELLDEMKQPHLLNVEVGSRPIREPAYGLGMMIDMKSRHGAKFGHTGEGPGSTCAIYHFADTEPVRTIAAFHNMMDQEALETLTLELAAKAMQPNE